jgi:high-affinity Fe2+/Pb2+ permease
MKTNSEFGKISGVDLLNALYHALVASVFPFLAYLNKGIIPETRQEWIIMIGVFLSAFFGTLLKQGVTNSNGELFKKETT